MRKINIQKQSGFSLIELMVSLLISGIIFAGVIQVFIGGKHSEQIGNSLARIQENGRFAVNLINKSFRIAGYQGCTDPSSVIINSSKILGNNSPLDNFSSESILTIADTDANKGGDMTFDTGAGTDKGISLLGTLAGSDVIAISNANPAILAVEELDMDMAADTDAVRVDSNDAGFSEDDLLLITNCTEANIFRVSAVNPGVPVTLSHSGSKNSSANFSMAFNQGTQIRSIVSNAYFIRNNPSNIPSLYRQSGTDIVPGVPTVPEELIEGVENMQIRYGIIDDKNDRANSNDTTQYLSAGDAGFDASNISSIRVALLIRHETEFLPENGPTSFNLLGETVTITADRRMRRVFTTTVKVRNRNQTI